MQNVLGKLCIQCGQILYQSPDNRRQSTMVCINPECHKWHTPQGVIEYDNEKYFAKPVSQVGLDTQHSRNAGHGKIMGAYGDF